MTRRTLMIVIAALFAVGALAGPTDTKKSPASEDRRFEITVTPEMRHHSHLEDTLYFVGTAVGLFIPALVLVTGLSRRLRQLASRVSHRKFLTAFVYTVLFTLVTSALQFPLDYYEGFVVPHQFDLSNQSLAGWLGDFGKELFVGLLIGGLLFTLALAAIRRFARWWIALWIGTVVVAVIGIIVVPIALDPLFNRFEPLKDASLRQALLDQASRAGIAGSRVFQVDKSKQTKEMNAYVTGLGPTKRIVLWDTLLAKLDRDEILAVMAHEMGHYVLHHIWIGVGWTAVISFFVCLLAQRAYEGGLRRWGKGWGVESKDDPAALPWLLIIVSTITFLLSPVINGISRHSEHEADLFGLELTHLNDAMASSFVKFAQDSKVDPTPNAFIEFWRYSHPSLTRRIDFVRHYKPWEEGKPNQAWKGGER